MTRKKRSQRRSHSFGCVSHRACSFFFFCLFHSAVSGKKKYVSHAQAQVVASGACSSFLHCGHHTLASAHCCFRPVGMCVFLGRTVQVQGRGWLSGPSLTQAEAASFVPVRPEIAPLWVGRRRRRRAPTQRNATQGRHPARPILVSHDVVADPSAVGTGDSSSETERHRARSLAPTATPPPAARRFSPSVVSFYLAPLVGWSARASLKWPLQLLLYPLLRAARHCKHREREDRRDRSFSPRPGFRSVPFRRWVPA
jgi:hypothetical protein